MKAMEDEEEGLHTVESPYSLENALIIDALDATGRRVTHRLNGYAHIENELVVLKYEHMQKDFIAFLGWQAPHYIAAQRLRLDRMPEEAPEKLAAHRMLSILEKEIDPLAVHASFMKKLQSETAEFLVPLSEDIAPILQRRSEFISFLSRRPEEKEYDLPGTFFGEFSPYSEAEMPYVMAYYANVAAIVQMFQDLFAQPAAHSPDDLVQKSSAVFTHQLLRDYAPYLADERANLSIYKAMHERDLARITPFLAPMQDQSAVAQP